MPYTDTRRETFAALQALMRSADPGIARTQRFVWLRPNDQTGLPEVTRRVTGLRKYRLLGARVDGRYPALGYRIWTVRDAETGDEFRLAPMANGTTVWVRHPKGEDA